MKATRQTAQNAVKLLAAFFEAHGPETIKAAYGWSRPPDRLVPGERFWAYHDKAVVAGCPEEGNAEMGQVLVGWGSMVLNTRDADDDDARLAVGVFPAYQRRGYRTAIYDHMAGVAKKLGADYASIIVFKANEAQYARTMREAHTPDSPWIYAGEITWRRPYGYFVRPL